ncbi:myosin-2 heavy chain isoform X2 [Drosophila hydei]|uniref:Myosin-2 heavy chain isoform X2 n=1 Tax=Drosophila hydei TaxID=7224 RepID=A0A6J1MCL2_DROHY|nr:myosin-2 heavy chain isoform X2 [Drosophila hydei]
MHHLYPSLKGDQLCPLGFHPQTRYPTRCKRCFRDYKEHGARRAGEEVAASSPNLSDAQSSRPSSRTWTSTQNLSANSNNSNDIVVHFNVELKKRPQSWASTPDIDEPPDEPTQRQNSASASAGRPSADNNVAVTLKLPVPPRRHTTALDMAEVEQTLTQGRATASPSKTSSIPDELVILSTDSLAERVRKMNLLKKQRSLNSRESSRERSVPRRDEESESTAPPPDRPERSKSGTSLNQQTELKRASLPPKKVPVVTTATAAATTTASATTTIKSSSSTTSSSHTETKVSASSSSSSSSLSSARRKETEISNGKETIKRQTVPAAATPTTASTLKEQMATLRADLEAMKARAERAEREKSDILLRRLASMDTASNRTAASEALNLQQKLNEMKEQLDRVTEDKRKLNLRMKELEHKDSQSELKRKLQAAEQICEELMEENQSAKKEILNLQAEMDEVQDTFRDDEVKAKTNLQKDLEKATKNCRILSFKLKKSERKIETLELERQSSYNAELCAKVKKLEEELRFSSELTRKLQTEAEELRNPGKKKAPMLGVLGKSTSADAKITRESLTRGGSQEDPQHLQRELQDSIERETDLKDQLKFAEEERRQLKARASRQRAQVNRGTQTGDMLAIPLGFPRSTQTAPIAQAEAGCNTSPLPETQAMHTQTQLVESSDMATQTNFELSARNVSVEREASPFVSLFAPSTSTRVVNSTSLLFPSAMSHVLLAGACAARKLSPAPHPHRLAPEVHADRDEGISDEDDPAELRILLELNEQEASILRLKVEDLEKENAESKKYVRELQAKLRQDNANGSKTSLLSFGSSSGAAEKKLKALNDELAQLRKTLQEKEQSVETMRAQLNKLTTLESENEKLSKENKRLQLQSLRKANSVEKNGETELPKLKDALAQAQKERDELTARVKRMQVEAEGKLPSRTPKRVNDLTPKSHLKKWVEELEDEISEMRVQLGSSGAAQLKTLQLSKESLEEELQKCKQKLTLAEGDLQRLKLLNGSSSKSKELEQKLKASEEESKKLNTKLKDLEDKLKKQESQLKQTEASKSTLETQNKREKEKSSNLEKDLEKQAKEREKLESKLNQLDSELLSAKKAGEKTKASLEKDIKDLKTKSSKSDSKQMQELKKQLEEAQAAISSEQKRYEELNTHWEKLSEETILMRAQLTTEKQNLQSELTAAKYKLADMDTIRIERTDMARKLNEAQKKIKELEVKSLKTGNSGDHERSMLKNKLAEKEHEYERLRRENEMNIDLVFQLRKDNDDLNSKLNDFNRIEQAQLSLNGHGARREAEIKELNERLQSAELQLKSEVASTRLRYEQQVKNLSGELNSMQRQCERFKKDRDAFKQMLEVAQKKIGDLKANNTGRQSRSSMHSSDDDDKSKIAYLEQQIGHLEDQLVESRLESSKVKTELVSERSANEIKISEMQSKLNEFEEERVIGSGSTKLPGMKTKLELSWQKEREDQQRLLQETSTLARDLRQTLFEVERERDKERLESKRKLDQTKRATEEEMEEGRKKIAELQCDLLELRDVHAKLRTSNEKLRRERERYEKELIKRRLEQDGGERKVGALLQTVDELVKIAPDLKIVGGSAARSSSYADNKLRPEQADVRRSRSPSPTLSSAQITNVLARLAEASEELRKFQRFNEDEQERSRIRRGNLRRAASQENDPHGSTSSVASAAGSQRGGGRLSRNSSNNGSLIRKSLSLDHSIQRDQNIWRQDDGSVSSMQSIDSELGGLVRDSSLDSRLDSRLSGGSTQSDIPRGPRKKKKGIMGKLRSLTKSSRNSESEVSIQGSDSDISVASDMRSSKKDLRGRLSGMFKRSGSNSRSESIERASSEQRPVAVTVVGHPDGPHPRDPPPANSLTPKPIRSIKPPTGTPTTPTTRRRQAK